MLRRRKYDREGNKVKSFELLCDSCGKVITAGRMVLKVNGKRLELVELCALCVSVRVGKRSGGQKSEVK